MSDAEQYVATVEDSYVFRIHGGDEGVSLRKLIKRAHKKHSMMECFEPGLEALIAYGVELGLNIILDRSRSMLGSVGCGCGITVADLKRAVEAKLRKKYRRGVITNDIVETTVQRIILLAKPLSDKQNTPERQLQLAGISA